MHCLTTGQFSILVFKLTFCKDLFFHSCILMVVFPKEEEAKGLVRDAIAAGIFNDLGSGSNIDLCVITKGNVDYIRPHDEANKKGVR